MNSVVAWFASSSQLFAAPPVAPPVPVPPAVRPTAAIRTCCAAPPFSTCSPSGLSEEPPVPFSVASLKSQNVEPCVQKLFASLLMNPVFTVSTAGLPTAGGMPLLASARNTAPLLFCAKLYILRLPSQRGALLASGRKTPT